LVAVEAQDASYLTRLVVVIDVFRVGPLADQAFAAPLGRIVSKTLIPIPWRRRR